MTKKIITATLLTLSIIGNSFAGNGTLIQTEKPILKKNILLKSRRSSSDKTFGVGVQMSNLKLFGAGFRGLKGFGINALFSPNGERNAFFGDFNYYLPVTRTTDDYAHAYSSTTSPSEITINVNTKLSGTGFRIGYRRYLINDVSEEGFKMYFQAAIGLLMFKATNTAADYNQIEYSTNIEPTSTATGLTIGGGFGLEYSIASKINLFIEGDLNIPANTVNGEEVEVEIPISVQSVFGLRYHF